MKKFLGSSRFKAYFIPVVLFLIFALLLVSTILKQEQRFPSKGWSRGIDLHSTLSYNTYPLISKEKGKYHIYTKSDNSVNEVVLNNKLETEKKASLPVKIPDFTQFWTDGKRVVFVKGNQLIEVKEGRSTVLAQNIDGLTPYGRDVVYWNSDQIFIWDSTSQKIKKVVQTPYPIDSVVSKSGSNYLLIQSLLVEREWIYIGIVSLNDGGKYHPVDKINQNLDSTFLDFDFVTHQKHMYVVYFEFGSTSGGMYKNNYLVNYNLNTYKKQQRTKLINAINGTSNVSSEQPHMKINWINGGVAILYQDHSTLFRGEDAQNIFLAKLNGNTWVSQPVSSTVEPSANPLWLTHQSVLWNDHIGNHYTLMLGSQLPQLIQKSDHITQRDLGNAISRALLNLTISLLMIVYALLWVIPTLVFIVAMFVGNMTLMERNPYWVRVVSVSLFIITQLLFIKELFNPTFYRYSPWFLQFPGNWLIIPLLFAGVSWYLTEWVKGEEWGNSLFIFYCILIDVLMLGFLIGPYTL